MMERNTKLRVVSGCRQMYVGGRAGDLHLAMPGKKSICICPTYQLLFFFFQHFYVPASGQAVVTGVVPSPPRFLPSIFIAHRVQQSHRSSIFHRGLLTHALAFSASQFVRKRTSPRIYTSIHSGGFELTKMTYTRLEDNLIRYIPARQ